MEYIKSINSNQHQIINDILKLHNNGNGIHLDCTYSKGVFYKKGIVKEPILKSDLYPQIEGCLESSSSSLPFEDNSIESIMFDPPFVISGKKYAETAEGSCKISKRFGAYDTWNDLKEHYFNSLKEFNRILVKNGLLIFKLQNTISSGKEHFTHYYTIDSAVKNGFYPLDEFVLLSKSKMTSFGGRWNTQRHALKYHSFFLVFRNTKCKVNYE
jgi:hypothetical protein